MYQQHFGLERPPFKITPDTSLFFEGNKRGAALEALVYAIESGEGIIKVVGEVGSGKTMLCRMLELRLPANIDVVYIANPSLSPDNILHVIAHELGLPVNPDSSKLDVMQQLNEYLLDKHANNRQVVLFVEEAQSMPVDTLEEIRFLSNLETAHSKLLQMVLFGQPELDEKLAQPHIRQLKERITHSFYLDPFPPRDTMEYLNFRLRSVGYRGPDVFNQKTANVVEKYSNGLTRRINILADKALMASYSEGGHAVTAKHVKVAAKDSDFEAPAGARGWQKKLALTGGGLLALVAAVWIGTQIPGLMQDVMLTAAANDKAVTTAARVTTAQPAAAEATATEPLAVQAIQPAAGSAETRPAESLAAVPSQQQSDAAVIDQPPLASLQTAAGSLLQQRLDATQAWFDSVPDSHLSIQLFLTRMNDADGVEEFLRNASETLDFQQIYIYETVINNNELYSVLYGDFASWRAATAELENLPAGLRASQPFLRRVSTFRKASVRNSPEAA